MIWPFRAVVDLLFLTTGVAGGLLENEQIVPRVRDFFFTPGGEIGVFPTLFLETGTNANVGVRFIGTVGPYAASLRGGYGGPDANVVEGRMRYGLFLGVPTVLSLEGFHDWRPNLGFLGLGQTPATDPRNAFRIGPATGVFRERRERVVFGFGARPLTNLEILPSTSLTQRYVADPESPSSGASLTDVFLPSSIPGAYRTTRISYTELAVRYDSRLTRNGLGEGVLVEGYGGYAHGLIYDDTRFWRLGGQAALFLPVVHRTTILSPRLVVDGLVPTGDAPIPFTEYTGQPTFRGFDDCRDLISVVASLDYRWTFMRFVSARLFTDVAKVYPSVSEMNLRHLRWAAGAGIDLYSSNNELGRIAVSGSPDGFQFLLTLGVSPRFGDRQHRN